MVVKLSIFSYATKHKLSDLPPSPLLPSLLEGGTWLPNMKKKKKKSNVSPSRELLSPVSQQTDVTWH